MATYKGRILGKYVGKYVVSYVGIKRYQDTLLSCINLNGSDMALLPT